MNNIIQSLKIIILATVLSFGLSYVYAWTAPTLPPPDGNVSAPINTSTTSQVKGAGGVGGLGIEGLIRGYSNAIFDGNVGIGTTNPQAKLDVAGGIVASGVVKVGNGTAIVCNSSNGGMIRYTGTDIQGCVGGVWTSLSMGSTPPPPPSPLLVNGQHTEAQCTAGGGTVITNAGGNFCKFATGAAPSGWTSYLNWSVTIPTTCHGATYCAPVDPASCTTGSHSLANMVQESCVFASDFGPKKTYGGDETCVTLTCYATRTELGYY